MDLTKIAEIIESTFKEALEQPIYRFGLPGLKNKGTKVNTGTLRDSIEAVPTSDGIFIFMEKYGKWVQSGRQPGKYVPLDPLEKWIIKKGLRFKDKNGKDISTRGMAAILSKHIYKWGIPTSPPWMDYAILQLEKNTKLQELLGQMAVDDLVEKIQGI